MCRSVYRRPNRAQSQGGVLGLAGSCFAEPRSQPASQAVPVAPPLQSPAACNLRFGGNNPYCGRGKQPQPATALCGIWRQGIPRRCQLLARRSTRHHDSFGYEAPGRYGSLARDQDLGGRRRAGARPLLEVDAAPHGIQAHPERVHRPRGHPASGHGPDRSLDHPTRPAGSRRMAADTDDPLWTVLFGSPSDRRGIRRETPASSRGDRQGARCPSGFNG